MNIFISAKERNLNDLKKELEVDDHKITPEELYRKHGVNPETGLTAAQVISFPLREPNREQTCLLLGSLLI